MGATPDHENKEVNLGIIITPMLDMAFQLLAFFVMTYHPSALEGHIMGELLPPETEDYVDKKKEKQGAGALTTRKAAEEELSGDDDIIKVSDEIKLRVIAHQEGTPSQHMKPGMPYQIKLKTPAASGYETVCDFTDPEIDPNKSNDSKYVAQKVDQYIKRGLVDLLERMVVLRKEVGEAKANVKLHPDGNLKHYYFVSIYDSCKKSGFKKVNFVAPSLGGQ